MRNEKEHKTNGEKRKFYERRERDGKEGGGRGGMR